MSDALRVAVDVAAVPPSPAGAGRYIVELMRAFDERNDVALSLFCRRDDVDRWKTAKNPTRLVFGVAPNPRPFRMAFEEFGLGRKVRSLGSRPSVFFGPHYTMAKNVNVPRIVTVHDLTLIEHPEWHERVKVVVFRRAMAKAARDADGIIFVSARVREQFLSRFIPKGGTFVVPHGLDHSSFRAEEPRGGYDDGVLDRLGVRSPYVLSVGTIEPRKNHATLVEAFSRMSDDHPDLSLVFAGKRGWGVEAVERAIKESTASQRITRLGYVADAVLPPLYRHASVVCYPSIEEGFGIPTLEALACGATVLTSANSPMADLGGDAVMTVNNPRDIAELSEALIKGLVGDDERRRRGLEIAAGYTWERCAEQHVEAFRSISAR